MKPVYQETDAVNCFASGLARGLSKQSGKPVSEADIVLLGRGFRFQVNFASVKTVVADNYGPAYSMIQTTHTLVVCPKAATNLDALGAARVLYSAHPVTRSASGIISGLKASVLLREQIVLQSDSMILIRPTSEYISGDDGNA